MTETQLPSTSPPPQQQQQRNQSNQEQQFEQRVKIEDEEEEKECTEGEEESNDPVKSKAEEVKLEQEIQDPVKFEVQESAIDEQITLGNLQFHGKIEHVLENENGDVDAVIQQPEQVKQENEDSPLSQDLLPPPYPESDQLQEEEKSGEIVENIKNEDVDINGQKLQPEELEEEKEIEDLKDPPLGWQSLSPPSPLLLPLQQESEQIQVGEKIEEILEKERGKDVDGDRQTQEKEDEESEGPPSGWNSLPPPLPAQQDGQMQVEEKIEEILVKVKDGDFDSEGPSQQQVKQEEKLNEEMEGPPPGWHLLAQTPPPLPLQQERGHMHIGEKDEVFLEKEIGANADGDGPTQQQEQKKDEDLEGPPPGWDSLPPPLPPPLPFPQKDDQMQVEEKIEEILVKVKDEDLDSEGPNQQQEKQEEKLNEEVEGPPPGWHSLAQTPPPPLPLQQGEKNGEYLEKETGANADGDGPTQQEQTEDELEGPPPGWGSLPPPPPLPLPQQEKGQMVCGSCRRLLSYLKGSKYVQCSCCQTVNYVLEEHQVGQVKCGNCEILLMYPYGAQSVRCCSCRSVIYIGDHNRRPPLSVQQSQACRPFSIPT